MPSLSQSLQFLILFLLGEFVPESAGLSHIPHFFQSCFYPGTWQRTPLFTPSKPGLQTSILAMKPETALGLSSSLAQPPSKASPANPDYWDMEIILNLREKVFTIKKLKRCWLSLLHHYSDFDFQMNGQCTVAFTMWALVLKMPTLFFHSLLWKKGTYMSVPAPSPPEWSKTWLAVKYTTVVICAFVILSLSYFLLTKGPSSNQIGSLPQNWQESHSFYFKATHLSFWSKYICTQHRSN